MRGGIWLDWNNKNSRVTRNLVVATQTCCNSSIFVEASRDTNMVDHNVLWDVRGIAISAGDTDNLIVAHNLIGPTASIGVRASVITQRTLDGVPMTARGNRVVANIILAETPISFEDEGNVSDRNVFAAAFDLEAWQGEGQDAHSRSIVVEGVYDPERAELTFAGGRAAPVGSSGLDADVDFFGAWHDHRGGGARALFRSLLGGRRARPVAPGSAALSGPGPARLPAGGGWG